MLDDKFEEIIRAHAGEIFGQVAGLPDGHRKRFEQRLKEYKERCGVPVLSADCRQSARATSLKHADSATDCRHVSSAVSMKKRWIAIVATAAAVLAGIVFMLNLPEDKQHGTELADIRNYYNMQLEEQSEVTRQLALNVDDAHRTALLADIERIENDPIPDVQVPNDEYIVLIVNVYEKKIEILRNIQYVIRGNI
ncbi:MAG: hypothetical protein LBG28_00425 [Tannerella sp.]|jgi:hypothetical protein|nr:hypothetical protein [Tannerella sp.]